MKKRKWIVLMLTLVFTVVVATSCAAPATPEASSGESTGAASESAAPAESAAAATSAAETGKSDRPIKIGVSMQGLTAPFIAGMAQHFENVGKELGLEVTVLDGQNDAATQNNQIDNFIEQKMDAIVFNPISFDGGAPGVDAAVDAGIPIIIAQTNVSNSDKAVTYVGSSHYENGKMEIEGMIADNGNKLNIAVIEGVMGIDAQIERMQAYNDVIADNPDIKIVAQSNADWDRAKAMQLVENWINAGIEFDVVLSQNDNMALGAIEALRGHNLLDKVKVYGIDGDADALLSIDAGEMTATAWQNAEKIAREALTACVDAVNGKTVEKNINVPGTWVTKENVKEYLPEASN